jgi:hypothetical protein
MAHMSPWPSVVVPAVITALVVRFDAKLMGPYFALSELIGASDSTTSRHFYGSATLRAALWRRLLYALILGFVLAWTTDLALWEVAAVGILAAGLLLWPVLFHGLPFGISRRDWELPVLYVAFVGSYAALAASGALLQRLMRYVADGDVKRWLGDQLLGALGAWIIALFLLAIYRAAVGRLTSKAGRREEIGLESDWQGTSSMVDAPPPGSP